VKIVNYSYRNNDKDNAWSTDTIEQTNGRFGLLLGPEVNYSFKQTIFARGFYLLGKNDLPEGGNANRKQMGADIGLGNKYGWVFIGYRKHDLKFAALKSEDIKDNKISDFVIGLGTLPHHDKPGFNIGGEIVAGVKACTHINDSGQEFDKVPLILEFELNTGYRFTTLPFTFEAGLGAWIYENFIREYNTDYPKVSFTNMVTMESAAYGGTLKVLYNF
jgi:hypothetical protein